MEKMNEWWRKYGMAVWRESFFYVNPIEIASAYPNTTIHLKNTNKKYDNVYTRFY